MIITNIKELIDKNVGVLQFSKPITVEMVPIYETARFKAIILGKDYIFQIPYAQAISGIFSAIIQPICFPDQAFLRDIYDTLVAHCTDIIFSPFPTFNGRQLLRKFSAGITHPNGSTWNVNLQYQAYQADYSSPRLLQSRSRNNYLGRIEAECQWEAAQLKLGKMF